MNGRVVRAVIGPVGAGVMPKLVICLVLATASLVVGCTADGPGPEPIEGTGGNRFVLVTTYGSEGCRSRGSTNKFIDPGRAVDVDGGGEADLIRSGDEMLVRSATYPELAADRPWIRLPASSDTFANAGVRDLVEASVLGPDLAYLLQGSEGAIPMVQSYVDAGYDSPHRIVAPALENTPTNTEVSWTQDGDGSLRSIQIVYEDQAASAGTAKETYDLRPGELEVPRAPRPDEVQDAGDLPALALLGSTPNWAGECRSDQAFLAPDKLACYRDTVGDATAQEWMSSRVERSWTDPDECGFPD